MQKSRFKRGNKMGDMPGDVSKRTKIRMMEKDTPIQVFPWQVITEKAAKGYRRDQRKRAKAKFNRREERAIEREL